jgi:hypothetical protein
LVIDWRDEEWSHDGCLTFDHYFELDKSVNYFPLAAFLEFYRMQGASMSVFPKFWQNYMLDTNIRNYVYKDIFRTQDHGKIFNDIADFKLDDFEDNIIVYAGTGFRAFTYGDFSSIKPNWWLSKGIRTLANDFSLMRGAYNAIHLRAGSKKWAGGKVRVEELATKLSQQFPDQATYLKKMRDAYESKCRRDSNVIPLIVLSDSASLAKAWLDMTGIGTYLKHRMDNLTVASGIHEANSASLEVLGVDKFYVNLEAIFHFAVLLNARNVVYDGMSLFSKMADSCKGCVDSGWTFPEVSKNR